MLLPPAIDLVNGLLSTCSPCLDEEKSILVNGIFTPSSSI